MVKNDLSKVRFSIYKPNEMCFESLTIEQVNEWVDRSYRKDGNKRKPTTLLKENGWIIETSIWNDKTKTFEIPLI